MAEEFPSNIPPEPRIEIPRENRFLALLKNILVFFVLVGVVVASFWISFQLGKKILIPTKKFPEPKITAEIPEPPPALQKLQDKLMAELTAGETKNAPKAVRNEKLDNFAPQTPRPAGSKRQRYYKLQVGLFDDKALADELAGRLKTAGIDVFVRKVSGGYRVQAGAYKTKAMAAARQETLNEKGYESQVVFE
ncbi:hypothetical protein A2625_02110 [candidate division WOR-1 bacterium RIFCSPHIGHO2_01_FULL_53_15]|uniref:SPOR domain-containing protein n=1 Tax=candidate division WOR-1 bacterium RIFCSPHIGHO2_01_FULL_53_15 TaxID=1802564 RepID=A0A1F4PYS5_UNCSA|nr:MAG: hypothetical protein A2625_02110 [candidate division WOR-1 bacterium RIFCSPHIGHO2_01_FULL_53_15]OGC10697.1 MAG: hypothetical protein A3D23_00800 [candidate division WOR-1 bacterium RIFCSPHIGHO2_02_FULL_53_26]